MLSFRGKQGMRWSFLLAIDIGELLRSLSVSSFEPNLKRKWPFSVKEMRYGKDSKFEKKAVRCVFTGYDTERKGWRCVDPVTGCIHVSRNVVFDEASSWWSSDHTTLPDSKELEIELQRKMNSDVMLEPVSEELVEPSVEETSNLSNSQQNPWRSGVHQTRSAQEMRPSQLNDSENEENVTVLRRSSRIPKPNPSLGCVISSLIKNYSDHTMPQMVKGRW
ncbi:hypothetical protein MRB53_025954 [Persea americana]|uniref:Uncharacterized protein n=1 Tax=Persea americana TaxID=3435 RepID=A0ACC2LH05_PERAE|nr:hypothetical protein MRB53_025954 [Persea americana]